jgi:hypothetical protein
VLAQVLLHDSSGLQFLQLMVGLLLIFFVSMSALHRVCCGKDLWKIITPEIVQIQCNMLAKE